MGGLARRHSIDLREVLNTIRYMVRFTTSQQLVQHALVDRHIDGPSWSILWPRAQNIGQSHLLAVLRHDRIDAPCVLDQPINGVSFLAWIEQFLAPTLTPGGIVILDNLSSHNRPAIRRAIRATGARLLFLPPYSPDLNPIEQMFAKLKHLLRAAAERTKEATWQRIGTLLDRFPPDECANYLRNSGYGAA